ncbi:MAG: right-handed parallel beta-helix repeat-containing protein [Thermoplasmatota archaeon]
MSILGFASANTTLFVGGSGDGNYSSIQDALNNAFKGDVIYVYAGTYYENIIVNISVLLMGEDKETTIINGGGHKNVVLLQSDNCMVSGFTIINSGMTFPLAGITVNSNDNTIIGNNIYQNYYGIRLELTSGNLISDNHIWNNFQCGVYFSRASNNILSFNIVKNHSFNGFGLYEFSDKNLIIGNVFRNNSFSGVNIRDSYDNSLEDNQFIENTVGLHSPTADYKTDINSNLFTSNAIDVEIEVNPHMTFGSGYAVFLIVAFFIIKKFEL